MFLFILFTSRVTYFHATMRSYCIVSLKRGYISCRLYICRFERLMSHFVLIKNKHEVLENEDSVVLN